MPLVVIFIRAIRVPLTDIQIQQIIRIGHAYVLAVNANTQRPVFMVLTKLKQPVGDEIESNSSMIAVLYF